MRIFVTGSTGFVGSRLCEKLANHNIVYGLARNDGFKDNRVEGVNYLTGDLLQYDRLKQLMDVARPEVIVHTAAYTPVRYSYDQPLSYAYENYIGTVNLVEAALDFRAVQQIVYASTAEIYGPYEEAHTVTEESIPTPSSPYSISKLAGEHYVKYAVHRQKYLYYTVLRPTNTFGRSFDLPEDARGYFVEKLIIGVLKGKVAFDGFSGSTRKWLRVEDHVGAYLHVIGDRKNKALNQTFNVAGEEKAVTLGEVAETVKRLANPEAEIEWGANPRPLDPNHLDIDGHKIRHDLGWKPAYTLEAGLAKTVEYWREKLGLPKRAMVE